MSDRAAIDRNIRRIRLDIRKLSAEMQRQIDADQDCSSTARALMVAQADLRLYLERRESLFPAVDIGDTEERHGAPVVGRQNRWEINHAAR